MQGPHFLEILHQNPHGTIDALGVLWSHVRGIRLLAGGELMFQYGQAAHDRGPQTVDDVLHGAAVRWAGFRAARLGALGQTGNDRRTRVRGDGRRAGSAGIGCGRLRRICRTSRRLGPTYGLERFDRCRGRGGFRRDGAGPRLPVFPFGAGVDRQRMKVECGGDLRDGRVRRLPGCANSLPIRRRGLGHVGAVCVGVCGLRNEATPNSCHGVASRGGHTFCVISVL